MGGSIMEQGDNQLKPDEEVTKGLEKELTEGVSGMVIEFTSYSAGDADHPDWFIHEYAAGRRVLTSLNAVTGESTFLKEL